MFSLNHILSIVALWKMNHYIRKPKEIKQVSISSFFSDMASKGGFIL